MRFVLLFLFVFGCNEMKTDSLHHTRIFTLSPKLKEISGIVYQQGSLHAINDEEGIIYILDPTDGSIIDQLKIGNNGDYEGITYHNNTFITIQSNGTIITKEGDQYRTPFTEDNDVESITSDGKKLYIATKEAGLNYKKNAIYAYDWINKSLNLKPVFLIDKKELKAFAERQNSEKEDIKRTKKFAPSDISYYKDHFYILSGKGSMLAVYTLSGQIKNLYFLDQDILPQPEGLCFDNRKNLYISTEGKQQRALISVYKIEE